MGIINGYLIMDNNIEYFENDTKVYRIIPTVGNPHVFRIETYVEEHDKWKYSSTILGRHSATIWLKARKAKPASRSTRFLIGL